MKVGSVPSSQEMKHAAIRIEPIVSVFITRKSENNLEIKSPGCGILSTPMLIYSREKGGLSNEDTNEER